MGKEISRRSFLKTSTIAGAAVGLGLGVGGVHLLRTREKFDLLVKGGLIYNGEGGTPFVGDLAVKEGRIVAIGSNLGDSASKIIEAKGMALSPGFIDIHTHTDTKLFDAPLGDSRIMQGVTTDVGGNCGGSPFLTERFSSLDKFFEALPKDIGINYATFVGQGTLRDSVVGNSDVPATKEQIEEMKSVLAAQMEQGAVGLTAGLEYAPGCYASDLELTELCKVVASYDGLFAIHMRNESDRVEESLKESIEIARSSGVRLQISHLKTQNAGNWHKAPNVLRMIESAAAEGIDISFDRYPYTAFNTDLSSFIPLNLREGGKERVLGRLKDKTISAQIGEYAVDRFQKLGGAKNVVINFASLEHNQRYVGKSVEECAEMAGMDPWPFVREMLIEEELRPEIIGFAMSDDNVKLFLSHRLGMPASDGSVYAPYGRLGEMSPHPRSYGTFAKFIGHYTRDEKLMPLSKAIEKCTKLPAERLRLKERGLLQPGYWADLLLFNPDTIIDKATYADPHQYADGILEVVVNGVHTISNGEVLKGRGGVLIT